MQQNRIEEDTGRKKLGKRSNGQRREDRLCDRRTSSAVWLQLQRTGRERRLQQTIADKWEQQHEGVLLKLTPKSPSNTGHSGTQQFQTCVQKIKYSDSGHQDFPQALQMNFGKSLILGHCCYFHIFLYSSFAFGRGPEHSQLPMLQYGDCLKLAALHKNTKFCRSRDYKFLSFCQGGNISYVGIKTNV